MLRQLATTVSLGIVLALPAAAQQGNPAGMTPGVPEAKPGQPAPHETNAQDRLFVMLIGAGGMAEVEFGRMAGEKGSSTAVKGFAERMVREHGRANDELASLAQAAGIPVPQELDPDHQAMREQLQKLRGREFDLAYIRGQVIDHQKTVQILEWELGSGQDPALKMFAMVTLPRIFNHLHMAQTIASELTGQAPPRIAENVPAARAVPQVR